MGVGQELPNLRHRLALFNIHSAKDRFVRFQVVRHGARTMRRLLGLSA